MRKIYALVLVGGLLVGAPWAITNALFTDSVSVDANTFTNGTVDISAAPATGVVTFSNMAPGDSTTQSLAVTNAGSLAQRYSLTSSATNLDSQGLKDQLTMVVRAEDATAGGTACDSFDGTQLYSGDLDGTTGVIFGDIAAGDDAGDRTLAAAASENLCFRVALPIGTGNAFQGASTTATFTFDAEQTVNNP